MNFLSMNAAKEMLGELEKLPALLVKKAESEGEKVAAKLKADFESRFAALESKAEADVGTSLDDKVKAVLEKLEGEGLDLSALKSAIGGMTGNDLGEADDEGASDASKGNTSEASTITPAADESKKADIGSLAASTGAGFSDFSHAVDAQSKVDPAAAGKQAADAARAVGDDPVPAAAKAAHAAATANGDDAVKAATEAAAAEGAGTVEAARAAENAAA